MTLFLQIFSPKADLSLDEMQAYGIAAVNWAVTNLDLSTDEGKKLTPDQLVAQIEGCRNLKRLNLEGCQVTTEVAAAIAKCKDLQHLNISDTQATNAVLTILSQNCPKLEHLDVSNTKVTGAYLSSLSEKCSKLQHLALRYCSNLGDFELKSASLPQLRHLDLSYSRIEDDGVAQFAKASPSIQHLNLEETPISPESVSVLAENCQQLQHLNLKYTSIDHTNFPKNCWLWLLPSLQIKQYPTDIADILLYTNLGRV